MHNEKVKTPFLFLSIKYVSRPLKKSPLAVISATDLLVQISPGFSHLDLGSSSNFSMQIPSNANILKE